MERIRVRVHGANAPLIEEGLRRLGDRMEIVRGPQPDTGRRVLVAFRDPGDEDISRYDWIHIAGAGADHIAPALRRGEGRPIVTRTVGRMGRQMAEYALSYTLAFLQRHDLRARLADEGRWDDAEAEGRFLFDTEVAILGTGGVARGIASVVGPLAQRVTGHSRSGAPVQGFTEVRPLPAFAGADVVIAALPDTPSTRNIIGRDLFDRLEAALFINVGRGATVDETALRRALEQGRIARAVLDVFAEEPLPRDHWAWHHPQVTATPHVSGITRPQDTVAAFAERWPRFLDGCLESEVDAQRGY